MPQKPSATADTSLLTCCIRSTSTKCVILKNGDNSSGNTPLVSSLSNMLLTVATVPPLLKASRSTHRLARGTRSCVKPKFRSQVSPASIPFQYENLGDSSGHTDLTLLGLCALALPIAYYSWKKKYQVGEKVPIVSNRDDIVSEGTSRIEWGGYDSEGPREEMEDAWCARRLRRGELLYLGVFDGHGGAASSAYLKDNLIRFTEEAAIHLCAWASKERVKDDYTVDDDNTMAKAYQLADSALLDHLGSLGDPECWSGSTATTCFVSSSHIITANVGDSRAVLGRKGKTIDISSDHRPVGSSKTGRAEIKRISECGGWTSQMRVCGILAVSRAFGDYEFKGGRQELLEELQATCAPESCSLQNPPIIALPSVKICPRLIDDDFLIIATDGLWDVMNSAQAITYVRSMVKQQTGCTMHEVAVSLVERALRSRTQDNVSCVVVDLRTS